MSYQVILFLDNSKQSQILATTATEEEARTALAEQDFSGVTEQAHVEIQSSVVMQHWLGYGKVLHWSAV